MEPIIAVKNLRKTYTTFEQGFGLKNSLKDFFKRKNKTVVALGDLSFEIGKGELVGLIGPNGAGKSTTLKILSGILFPTSGKVQITMDGETFVPWKDRTRYVKGVGVVFGQKSQLWFDLPPIDTYHLHKSLYDIPDADFKRRLDYFVKLLDIKDVINRPTRQLSLGERMKSEIVAALLHGPELVFLDEPTIGLDIMVKQRIRDALKEINKRDKITFILTTHDLQDIDQLCERVMILDKGALVYDGKLDVLKKRFIKEKRMELIFEHPPADFQMKGVKVEQKEGPKLTLALPAERIHEVTRSIVNKYELLDITISEPSIEQVIAHIYKPKK